MPIIKKIEAEIEALKSLKIEKKISDEVKAYCEHFKVSLDEFANQAFNFVLKKDTDWKKVKPKPEKEKASKEAKK